MNEVLQFGTPPKGIIDRPGAYGVIVKDEKLLTLKVKNRLHLPGGGINPNEDPKIALIREVKEETGYKVKSLEYIGKANQYTEHTKIGPVNKCGTFYRVTIDQSEPVNSEDDHVVTWVDLKDLDQEPLDDFQKWAVRKSI